MPTGRFDYVLNCPHRIQKLQSVTACGSNNDFCFCLGKTVQIWNVFEQQFARNYEVLTGRYPYTPTMTDINCVSNSMIPLDKLPACFTFKIIKSNVCRQCPNNLQYFRTATHPLQKTAANIFQAMFLLTKELFKRQILYVLRKITGKAISPFHIHPIIDHIQC